MPRHAWELDGRWEALRQRVSTDAALREDLKRDPRGTLARELGIAVPGETEIAVVEETATKAYLVLPAAARPAAGPLPDHALEEVSGGTGTRTGAGSTSDIDQGVKRAVDL